MVEALHERVNRKYLGLMDILSNSTIFILNGSAHERLYCICSDLLVSHRFFLSKTER
jgi:hypothetical protein